MDDGEGVSDDIWWAETCFARSKGAGRPASEPCFDFVELGGLAPDEGAAGDVGASEAAWRPEACCALPEEPRAAWSRVDGAVDDDGGVSEDAWWSETCLALLRGPEVGFC